MDEFSFETDVEVRYRDLDPMGHVNNAVYLTYLETARIRYLETVLGTALEESDFVVANLEIDFRAPIRREHEAVTVGVRVTDLGTASVSLAYDGRADGDTAAVAESTLVAYDRETGESRPLPDSWRAAVVDFEGL